jgi:3'(2'), 5'-bisphosphate nucleotidase
MALCGSAGAVLHRTAFCRFATVGSRSVPAFDSAECAELMAELTKIGGRAAQAIRDWAGKAPVRSKADGSPVTAADEAADAVICEGLARLAPHVPVISEEQAARRQPKPPRGAEDGYFLVDPLDGTREFIAGRDEYTVNIALILGGAPILGLIVAPAFGLTWRGIVGHGADRIADTDGEAAVPHPIRTRPRSAAELVALASRSHLDGRTRAYLDGLPQATVIQCGSSIKFCRIAEGAADLYPRFAPTHDWDIAAGHAILKAAGGAVTALDGSRLVYGSDDLLIPAFLASGAPITA